MYNPAPDLANAMNKPKNNHFPFLTESELPDFVQALNNYKGSQITKYATQLLMLTGVRTLELRAAEWVEFGLDNALWEIPKEQMKKRRPHLVPLSTQAIAILKERKVLTGYYQPVFLGRNDTVVPLNLVLPLNSVLWLKYNQRRLIMKKARFTELRSCGL